MDDEKKMIVDRLRKALKEKGVSFKEAARKAGISERTLEKWVQGASMPKIDQFAKLTLLGINPLYVISGEGPPLLSVDDRTKIVAIESLCKKKLRKRRSFLRSVSASW